jgi:hypothetical protein
MGKLTAKWVAWRWDTERYCVKRRATVSHDGWDYLDDGCGRVVLFASRSEAMRAALKETVG